MNHWLALILAFAIAFPLLWYNLRDFLGDVDEGLHDRDDHDNVRGADRWFRRIKLFWQLGLPVLVFVLAYVVLSSVSW